jgi:RHS repeat-associated protein
VMKSGPDALVPSTLQQYVYDEAGHLIGEYDASGAVIEETVYLGDIPVAVLTQSIDTSGPTPVTNTNVNYIYADQINTPRMITQASDNQIIWRWDAADPFGMLPPDEDPSGLGTFTYNLRFPGQIFDRETNLHYNGFRDYDPQQGRYTQSDPIGLAGGLNSYSYVLNDPTRYVDAAGLQTMTVPVVIGVGTIACILTPGCMNALSNLGKSIAKAVGDFCASTADEGSKSSPPIPGNLVGDQSDPRAGQRGSRHTSGPLTPSNGGVGDASKDFDHLTGGTGQPFPDGNTRPPGSLIGDNGIWIRPGKNGEGPRIEIPGNENKPPETLHY